MQSPDHNSKELDSQAEEFYSIARNALKILHEIADDANNRVLSSSEFQRLIECAAFLTSKSCFLEGVEFDFALRYRAAIEPEASAPLGFSSELDAVNYLDLNSKKVPAPVRASKVLDTVKVLLDKTGYDHQGYRTRAFDGSDFNSRSEAIRMLVCSLYTILGQLRDATEEECHEMEDIFPTSGRPYELGKDRLFATNQDVARAKGRNRQLFNEVRKEYAYNSKNSGRRDFAFLYENVPDLKRNEGAIVTDDKTDDKVELQV